MVKSNSCFFLNLLETSLKPLTSMKVKILYNHGLSKFYLLWFLLTNPKSFLTWLELNSELFTLASFVGMWKLPNSHKYHNLSLTMYSCIKWVQDAFPPGGDCSGLVVIFEQCVRTFWHEESYKNDLRYLKVWLEYVSSSCAFQFLLISVLPFVYGNNSKLHCRLKTAMMLKLFIVFLTQTKSARHIPSFT